MNQLSWLMTFFYVVLIGLLLMDIAHGLNQLSIAHRHEKILQTTVLKAESDNSSGSQFKKITHDFAIIDEITYLAHLNHLELNALKSVANKGDNDFFTFKLIATGNFAEFVRFLEMMAEKEFIFRINRFSLLMLPQNNISIAIDISVLKFYFVRNENNTGDFAIQNWQDPFSVELNNSDDQRSAMLHSIAIQKIQFVGYLKKSDQMIGIVMLPDEESLSVAVGDHLGVENAEVTRITERGMGVRVNQQEQWIEYKF